MSEMRKMWALKRIQITGTSIRPQDTKEKVSLLVWQDVLNSVFNQVHSQIDNDLRQVIAYGIRAEVLKNDQ